MYALMMRAWNMSPPSFSSTVTRKMQTMPSTEQIAFRTMRAAAGRWMMRKWLEMKNVMEMAATGRTRQQKRA